MNKLDKLKYEMSFYKHLSHGYSTEENKLAKAMINNYFKYLLFANLVGGYTYVIMRKRNKGLYGFYALIFSNLVGIYLSNEVNYSLLNMYNIFSFAPPDFWILRSKTEDVKILLDKNFKVEVLK